jgi:ferric-dicitrate binding protein FerR (iron transport regulator)
MKDSSIHSIHKFLNREIDLDELKKQLSKEEFDEWQATLTSVDDLPKAAFKPEKEFELLKSKRPVKQQKPWRYKIAIAAVFLIFTSLLTFNYFSSKADIVKLSYSSALKENVITLPDSSKVWLNKGATISYNASEWATNRELQLEGEAYFEVKRGQKFTVNSSLGSVNVLGTTFSVATFKDVFLVTCYTGKVAVNHQSSRVILEAKDAFSSQNNQVSKVNTTLPTFMRKWSMFEKTPLAKVIQSIEEMKQVTIELKLDKTYLFSGGYSSDMVTEDIVKLISQSLGVSYRKINENRYEIIDSSKP